MPYATTVNVHSTTWSQLGFNRRTLFVISVFSLTSPLLSMCPDQSFWSNNLTTGSQGRPFQPFSPLFIALLFSISKQLLVLFYSLVTPKFQILYCTKALSFQLQLLSSKNLVYFSPYRISKKGLGPIQASNPSRQSTPNLLTMSWHETSVARASQQSQKLAYKRFLHQTDSTATIIARTNLLPQSPSHRLQPNLTAKF